MANTANEKILCVCKICGYQGHYRKMQWHINLVHHQSIKKNKNWEVKAQSN